MTFDFPIKFVKKRSRRSLSIRVKNGIVVVGAPSWLSDSDVANFIHQKVSWIKSQLENQKKISYQDGSTHLFLGQDYSLRYQLKTGLALPKIIFDLESGFTAQVPAHRTPTEIEKLVEYSLKRWYEHKGDLVISDKVKHWAAITKLKYGKITLKQVSSIWGSCSARGNLSFNKKLILAQTEAIDYVVIHELCHLVHRHHRRSFWDLVARYCPDYKRQKNYLKKNQARLIY